MGYRTASRLAGVCVLFALARTARADEPSASDKHLAQSLFDQARALMDQGRYADACPRFADSERLDPGGGTLLNLALCYDKLGKLALAYDTYSEAISVAIAEHRREREKFARDRVAALGPRLPRLTLKITDVPAGMEVHLDGANVPLSAWGTAMTVDPGEHVVEATAPDRAPWKAAIHVTEGETSEVPIVLTLAAPPPAAVVAPTPAPAFAMPPLRPHPTSRSTAPRPSTCWAPWPSRLWPRAP